MTRQSEHIDVLIIGAGISGIGAAHYLQTERPGSSYAILGSSNLTSWAQLMSVVNTNGTLDLIDNSASNAAVRFYRTRQ